MNPRVEPNELPPLPSELGEILLAALALIAVGVWLTLTLRRRWDVHQRRERVVRAQRAERDAARLLEAKGYGVVGRQVRRRWSVIANAREFEFTLIADYIVERAGRRWVAEVKTGERMLDLHHGPTRRQLLEYGHAFGVDGVLLVDAEGQELTSVQFHQRTPARANLLLFGAGLIAGVLLGGYLFSTAAKTEAAAVAPAKATPKAKTKAAAGPAGRVTPASFHGATN